MLENLFPRQFSTKRNETGVFESGRVSLESYLVIFCQFTCFPFVFEKEIEKETLNIFYIVVNFGDQQS